MRSRIEPVKKIARSLRQHRETDPQLFSRSETAFQRSCRGSEQQGQSHHEKILRFPHLPLPRTCALSLTWQITRAGIDPRILLTNQFFYQVIQPFRVARCGDELIAGFEHSLSNAPA